MRLAVVSSWQWSCKAPREPVPSGLWPQPGDCFTAVNELRFSVVCTYWCVLVFWVQHVQGLGLPRQAFRVSRLSVEKHGGPQSTPQLQV